MTDNKNLRAALNLVNNYLNNFANSSDFSNGFDLAFGNNYDRHLVRIFQKQWQTKTFTIPPIQIVQDRVLGTAVGAFAASNNTIYISETLATSGNIDRLTAVLLEELGHSIDARINTKDSAGDEGEIFSNLVRGNHLSATQLAALKAEDDRAVITINGKSIVVEQANPTAGNDLLDGTSDDDTIDGLGGNDTINGLAGNDSLIGGIGDDTINAGTGIDTVVGGTGNDLLIINYSGSTTSIFPSPSNTIADNGANGYSGDYFDSDSNFVTFSEIERFDITGGSGNDYLLGGKNNDALKGGAGNDSLDGGGGVDTIDGGAGNDTLVINFRTLTTAVTGNLGTGNGIVGGVSFSNIEVFNLTTGSGNDSLTGGGLNDFLIGGAGNDTISGLAGNDRLIGGDGNDIINGGEGNDGIDGGIGDDTINAGTGTDTVVGGTGNDLLVINYSSSTTPVSPSLSNPIVDNGTNGYSGDYSDSGSSVVSFSEIERFDLTGGSGDDYLLGGKNNDALKGGAGNDSLDGGGGVDTIDGGAGNDTLVINFRTLTTAVTGNLGAGSGIVGGVSFSNIEAFNVTTGSGNDNLTGGGLDDTITGGAGNDTINGLAGNDRLIGGDGNDTISGGEGNDAINGGIGDDTINAGTGTDTVVGGSGNDLLVINYSRSTTPVSPLRSNPIVDNGANGYSGQYSSGFADNKVLTFSEIERFDITGGSDGDDLFGGKNNDTLKGGAGDDRLYTGGGGVDIIDGGSGTDTVVIDFSTLTTAVTASVGTGSGTVGGVTFSNVEAFDLTTGSGNDSLTGGNGRDIIIGGAGNDTIDGGISDFDFLSGGAGNDIISAGTGLVDVFGGTGNDLLVINYRNPISLSSSDPLSDNGTNGYSGEYKDGDSGSVTFSEIERFDITGGNGDDNLVGGKNNDALKGGAGNDLLDGGLGIDTFGFGGVGFSSVASIGLDTVSNFVANTDKIKLHKSTFSAITTAAGASIGTNFVSVTDDRLVFGASAAIIYSIASGRLFYNADGATLGAGANGGQFAILPSGLTLSASDFIVVDDKINLSVAPASVTEDGIANLVYTFTRTDITNSPLTVNFTVGGTGTFNNDYAQTGAASFTATTGSVTFAPGAATATVKIDPTTDTIFEANETVALTLASGTGYSVGTTTAVTGTITNDDTQVTLAVAPLTVNEDGTTNLVYTFTRAGVTTNALTVNYSVGGTATLGTDYAQTGAATFTATTGTVTFAAGATTAIVTIDPTGDPTIEANETVALTLASGTGYSVGTTTAAIGTILDDDLLPAISIADLTIVEGINGNPSQSLITVSLNKASTQSIGVNYATSNVTAIAGTDYTATTGTLTFAAGQTSLTIAVPILNDNLNEPNETFSITLINSTNATIADDRATITITDTFTTNVTTTLAALVENVTLTGITAINATGNDGNNVITGNAANNTLTGLNGNDTYVYDADFIQGTDTITETITGGIDTLDLSQTAAAVNINLGLTTAQTVNANLKLVIPVITLENFIGGSGNDRITGNGLDNNLNGAAGDDRIFAGGGNDILVGGGGNDVISGGAGNDIFAYSGLLSGATTATGLFGVDAIYDFTSTQDKISLSKGTFGVITSAAGAAIGANFITVDDDSLVDTQSAAIVYSLSSGGLFYNQNGVAAGFGTNGGEFANILGSAPLVGGDFTIVA